MYGPMLVGGDPDGSRASIRELYKSLERLKQGVLTSPGIYPVTVDADDERGYEGFGHTLVVVLEM